MSKLSATTARAPPGPRSLATVVNRWARSISRSFMAEQGREGCAQEQDCLQCCIQVIISNSPSTALNERFHLKCAYCESYFGATSPVDIEHFRPKGAVEHADGTLLKPGYYWLAAKWDNLLPSCIDCNRARNHLHAGDDDPELSGKANLFPIENDQRSDLDPGAETGESRLLIHPCRDSADKFFKYLRDGKRVITESATNSGSRHRKAERSIDVYGLNRLALANQRGDKLIRVKNQIILIRQCLELLGQDPDRNDRQQELALAICELNALQADDASYAGMTRFFMKRTITSLENKIRGILGDRLDAFSGTTITEQLLDKFPCPARTFSSDDGDLAGLLG